MRCCVKINVNDYEVTYELIEAVAVAIEDQAGLMVDDLDELPDEVAARIRNLASKQAEVLRQAVVEVAKYDAAMLRELGEDVDQWATHHPRLVREDLDIAWALQQGLDLQPEWEALWGEYIEARISGDRARVHAAAAALRDFDQEHAMGESGPHWKGHRSS